MRGDAFVNRFKRTLTRVVVMALLSFCARATAADLDGITMEIHPEQSLVPLHQPVDVTLILQNPSAQVAEIDLGDDRKGNIILMVTLPDGTDHTYRIAEREGLARNGLIKLQPGQTYPQHLLLNQWMAFSRIGTYRIEVQIRRQRGSRDGMVAELSPLMLSVSVGAPNSGALNDFSQETLNTLLASKTYAEAEQAAEVLSYTNDPIAVPYLARAFETTYPVQSLLVTGLERIGTDDSIRILLAVAHKDPQIAPEAIRQALGNLVNRTSDPDLKVQIRQALVGKM
jgi:hypothetical protein